MKSIIIFYYSTPFCKIKNNKIVFDNFNGKGYGCNPKYIAEEIIRQNLNYDMVWLVNDLDTPMPDKIRKVKYGTMKAKKELATAKVWIDNVRNYKGVKKKKNQFYIQTWHGTIGSKKVEGEVEKQLSTEYVKDAKNDGKITDLMITDNSFQANLFRKYFWYHGRIIEDGIPRNDILTDCPNEIKDKVYQYFDIEKDKKLVLYAPTFREHLNLENYRFDYHKCCSKLGERFGGEFVMLLRLHPNVAQYGSLLEYDEKVINASDYLDAQELLAVCDIGITDYSGVAYDMSRINKPVFLICKDLDEFTLNERKLLFNYNELPFIIAKTEKELFENIKNYSAEQQNKEWKKFYKKINMVNSNHSSKDIVEIIKKEMNIYK